MSTVIESDWENERLKEELATLRHQLAESKKTLEWLYRWIGHKPLSECVRKVSDTLQAMKEEE